jgi:pilus assembly protein Flp/PilA
MKNKIFQFANKLRNDQKGATAIEYGLIAALIAVVIIAGVTLLGTDVGNTFNEVANSLSN